jgi:hypothetical protein
MRLALVGLTLLLAAAAPSSFATPKQPRPDLADVAQGVYQGSVISDSRGAGRTNVTITVKKTGPNTVSVTSDYTRLPPFTAKLAKYMQTIQKTGPGDQVFLLELSKTPRTLGVTDDQASFTGTPAGAD